MAHLVLPSRSCAANSQQQKPGTQKVTRRCVKTTGRDARPSSVSDATRHSRNMVQVFHVFKANKPDTSNCAPKYSPRIDGDIYVVPPVPLPAELYPSSKNFPEFIVGLHRSSDRYPLHDAVLCSPRSSTVTNPRLHVSPPLAGQTFNAPWTPVMPSQHVSSTPDPIGFFPSHDVGPAYHGGHTVQKEKDLKDLFREDAVQATEDLRKFLWEKYPPYDDDDAEGDSVEDFRQVQIPNVLEAPRQRARVTMLLRHDLDLENLPPLPPSPDF